MDTSSPEETNFSPPETLSASSEGAGKTFADELLIARREYQARQSEKPRVSQPPAETQPLGAETYVSDEVERQRNIQSLLELIDDTEGELRKTDRDWREEGLGLLTGKVDRIRKEAVANEDEVLAASLREVQGLIDRYDVPAEGVGVMSSHLMTAAELVSSCRSLDLEAEVTGILEDTADQVSKSERQGLEATNEDRSQFVARLRQEADNFGRNPSIKETLISEIARLKQLQSALVARERSAVAGLLSGVHEVRMGLKK